MKTFLALAAVVVPMLLADTAFSQAINIDMGANTNHPSPMDGYGAAAGQIGTWNGVSGTVAASMAVPLVDTSGNATGVTLSIVGGAQNFETNNPNTTGNDDSLLDDVYDAENSTWTISGLADGCYEVYVYAWAPDQRTSFFTDVTLQGGAVGTQRIGGLPWTGSFVQGSGTTSPPAVPGHYHKDATTISNGAALVINVAVPTPITPASVNGLQIVPAGGIGCITTFCTAKTTLACGTPANISASGVPSASASSGFTISASPTLGCRSGLLLYTNQPTVSGVAFGGSGDGVLCLPSQGLFRAGPIDSGGTPHACDGVMSIDLNAFAQGAWVSSGCSAFPGQSVPSGFLSTPGTRVNTQIWGRDSTSTGQLLSDGLGYTVAP